jgi:hypothetical protein
MALTALLFTILLASSFGAFVGYQAGKNSVNR